MVRFAFGLVGAAFVLRLVLVFLPELGRDEAAYLYWSHHPRLDYAPLLQLQIFLMRLVSDEPWFLRLSQVVISGFTVFLMGQWMRARDRVPCTSVAALATVPWLVFAGGILHPDGLLVLGLMLFALGAESRKPWTTAAGAIVCAGAKLTGFVPAIVALVWLFRRRSWGPFALVLAGVVAFALVLRPETLAAARQFGRVEHGVLFRILILLLEMALIGGVLIAVPRTRSGPAGWTGILLVSGFGIAAVFAGQVKANWILPGLLLLWSTAVSRRVLLGFAAVGLVLSGLMVVGYAMPSIARSAEARLARAGLLPEYAELAGRRESLVASGRSWADYLAGFHGRVDWPDLPFPPDAIVSDDYGLACRIALECPDRVPVVVVPGDPLFDREPDRALGRQLMVAVRNRLDHASTVIWEGTMAHPVTGDPISLRLVEGADPGPESR